MVVAIARWLINPSDSVWLVYRRVQFWLDACSTAWSLLAHALAPRSSCCLMLQSSFASSPAMRIQAVSFRLGFACLIVSACSPWIHCPAKAAFEQGPAPLLVALSPISADDDPSLSRLVEVLRCGSASLRSFPLSACLNSSRSVFPPALEG